MIAPHEELSETEVTMQNKSRKVAMRIIMGVLALAIGFAIAGCGSGSAAPPPTPTPTPANPTASISSISPTSAPAGAAGFTLTVNGANFIAASTLEWNGSNRATTFMSNSQLQAQITAADVATGATVSVTVVNPAPGGGISNAANFSIVDPSPTLTNIFPTSAPAGALAFMLTVNGSNFVRGSTVEWNGNSRTTTFVSSTQLQAHVMAADLASPGKATVTVVNAAPGGGTSGGATFTIAVDTIVFESARALDGSDAANTGFTSNIWVMNTDGSGQTPLTKLTAAGSSHPNWSSDGSAIAFCSSAALDGSDAANGTTNIWVMNADGSGRNPLTKLTASLAGSCPAVWSPDGSKIAFLSSRALDGSDARNTNVTLNVWVMNADGSGQTPLTRLTASLPDSFAAVWSPDGSKIAVDSARALDGSDAANTNNISNIWVMNADGSGAVPLTKLTAPGAGGFVPAWSPDGARIAFFSGRALDGSDATNINGTHNTWAMNADGSGQAPLTKLTATNAGSDIAVWSPDSSRIAYTSQRALDGTDFSNTTSNIWTMNADGSNSIPLTDISITGVPSADQIWSPDGNKVFFASDRALNRTNSANANFTFNIWVVNADRSNLLPLTKLTANGARSASPKEP